MISKEELKDLIDYAVAKTNGPGVNLNLESPQTGESLRLKSAFHHLRSLYEADWGNGVEFGSGWEEFWRSMDDPEWEKYFATMDQLKTRVANMQCRLRELLCQAQDGKDIDEIIASLDKPIERILDNGLDAFEEKFLVDLGMLDGISPTHRQAIKDAQISMELDDLMRARSHLDRFVGLVREETDNFFRILEDAARSGVDTKRIRARLVFPRTEEGVRYPSVNEIGDRSDHNSFMRRMVESAASYEDRLEDSDLRKAESMIGSIIPRVYSSDSGWEARHPDFEVRGEGGTPSDAKKDFYEKMSNL